MPMSSTFQGSFLGGEVSVFAQGRTDQPWYRQALSISLNQISLEEGAIQRRPGFWKGGPTRYGNPGIVRRFGLPGQQPCYAEITWDSAAGASFVRFWSYPFQNSHSGTPVSSGVALTLVPDSFAVITSISSATPAVMTLGGAVTWNTGDTIVIYIDETSPTSNAPQLHGRELIIIKIDTTHFSLEDGVSGSPIVGASFAFSGSSGSNLSFAAHSLTLPAQFTSLAEIQQSRIVQADTRAFLMSSAHSPDVMALTNAAAVAGGGSYPTFSLGSAGLTGAVGASGPYLDPVGGGSQTGNSLGAISSGTTTPNFTISDGAYAFVSTDAGRLIRLWSQPPAFNPATTYRSDNAAGAPSITTYNGQYWQAMLSPAPNPPAVSSLVTVGGTQVMLAAWMLLPNQALWADGYITSVSSGTTVAVRLDHALPFLPTQYGGSGGVIDTWQLGLYTDTGPIYPTCGTLAGSRLWLSGAAPGRFDASSPLLPATVSNVPNFAPTDEFDAISDDNGISYTYEDNEVTNVFWMEPDHQGIMCGLQSGEVLISATTANDPITPTSVDAHKSSKFKPANIEPSRVGVALLFVQALARRTMEYLADAFSGKFGGRQLNEWAKHITAAGIKEIWYQEETAPVVWHRLGDGTFAGCTYRRLSSFMSQAPEIIAWHRHSLGSGTVQSMVVGSDFTGGSDTLAILSENLTGKYFFQAMTPLLEPNATLFDAWCVDSGVGNWSRGIDGAGAGIRFYGMSDLAGETVDAWICGLDCGSYVVDSSNGSIVVPYGADPAGLFTQSFVYSTYGQRPAGGWGIQEAQVDIIGGSPVRVIIPVAIGHTYVSQGQCLRPMTQADAHTETGSPLGNTRRTHEFAAFVTGAVGSINGSLSFNMDGGVTRPAKLLHNLDVRAPTLANQQFTGIYEDTIEADYNYDNMLGWQLSRPYPLTLVALSSKLMTQEQ